MSFISRKGVVPAGYLYNQLFPVPEEERVGSCFLTVPGITYLQPDESEEITLSIPKESEELDVEIPFEEGTVRIDKITRMTAQEEEHFDNKGNVIGVVKRPAVYIQVSAVSEKKELSLKSLICKRKTGNKAGKGLWENQRYDFNSEQNLSGFRVFYEEGDTEIVLKFSQSGFYWKQPYHLKLEL